VEILLGLPLAARRRVVRSWLEAHAPALDVSFRLIEEVLQLAEESAGRKIALPSGWNLRRGRRELLLESEALNPASDYEYTLAVPGAVEVPELGACIEARVVDARGVPEHQHGQLLDLERMPNKVLIRNWRAGDRYWPAHTAEARKVKELLSDRHATGAQKKLWPVAVAEGHGLIWMRGFAVPAVLRPPDWAAQAIWIQETASMM
jgi:hypothetical protein